MPNPVVVSDLEARFRLLTESEKTLATALLEDAWAILLAQIPDLESRMADGRVSDALVRSVVAPMTIRVLRNPDGRRQESESIDDYTNSWTIDSARSTGELYLSESEFATLLPRQVSVFAGSIRLGSSLT